MPENDRLEQILAEWLDRQDRGESSDPEDVIREHPDLASDLRARFETLPLIDRALGEASTDAPRQIGEYKIIGELGRGGMGIVYEAEQVPMHRRVALKVLYPAIANRPRAIKRFQREARAAGQLHHTNIVPVHGIGEDNGVWYYAMELVVGRSLSQVIAQVRSLGARPDGNRLSLVSTRDRSPASSATHSFKTPTGDRAYYVRIAEMFAGIADALEAAHSQGIIHRDIKPANLILDDEGVLKVMDFGLARVEGEGLSMTMTGDLLGTPAYMSPEQAMAKRIRIDHRTDIYSLGATLYEVLTLAPPFRGEDLQEICSKIITKDPALPRRCDQRIPKDLETIVSKAMEKDRDKRYGSAREMAEDLRRFVSGTSLRARPVGPVGRAVRKIQRNKVRSTLVASLVIFASAAAILAVHGSSESARRQDAEIAQAREAKRSRDMEYTQLCAQADPLLARLNSSSHDLVHPDAHLVDETLRLLARAIRLVPDRPDAYFRRSLIRARTLDQRLQDLDASVARGLPRRTAHLARATILAENSEEVRAAEERELAEAIGGESAEDLYFEGLLLVQRGRRVDGIEKLTESIELLSPGDLTSSLALHARALAREMDGDLEQAIEDLASFQILAGKETATSVRIASVWRRLGQVDLAEGMFGKILDQVREKGTEAAWLDLCIASSEVPGSQWQDRATAEALRIHPDSVGILVFRGNYLYNSRSYEGALEMSERIVALGAHSRRAYSLKGRALGGLGRIDEAILASDRAIELEPMHGSPWSHRAHLLAEKGLKAEALAALDRAQELGPYSHDVQHNRGMALERLGLTKEAALAYARAVAIDPECSGAQGGLGGTLVNLMRYEEGERALRKAIELDPDHARFRINLGLALKKQEDYDGALRSYERAIELDPTVARPHGLRANVLVKMGRRDDAEASIRRSIRLDPDDEQSREQLGWLLEKAGRHEEALLHLEKSLQLNPDYEPGLVTLGDTLESLGRFGAAVKTLGRAIDLGTTNHLAFEVQAGALSHLGRYDEALVAAGRAVELAPECAAAHYVKAKSLDKTGKTREAIAEWTRVTQLDPEHFESTLHLGFTFLLLGQFDRAAEAYDRAIELNPGHWQLHSYLIEAFLAQGKFDEATSRSRSIGEKFPDSAVFPMLEVRALLGLGKDQEARELALERTASQEHGGQILEFAYLSAVAGRSKFALRLVTQASGGGSIRASHMRARVHAALGDRDAALRWLNDAVEKGYKEPPGAAPDPDFRAFESDPDYSRLLEKMRTR
ncbi:MAG: tetratricopeptide repeat protein [Planctomycetota bacterium]|nr:tetratricopeptide repeat protein [Planctomycetota bacterium]